MPGPEEVSKTRFLYCGCCVSTVIVTEAACAEPEACGLPPGTPRPAAHGRGRVGLEGKHPVPCLALTMSPWGRRVFASADKMILSFFVQLLLCPAQPEGERRDGGSAHREVGCGRACSPPAEGSLSLAGSHWPVPLRSCHADRRQPAFVLFSCLPDSLLLLKSLCQSDLYKQPGCPTCPVAFSDQNGRKQSSACGG